MLSQQIRLNPGSIRPAIQTAMMRPRRLIEVVDTAHCVPMSLVKLVIVILRAVDAIASICHGKSVALLLKRPDFGVVNTAAYAEEAAIASLFGAFTFY